MHKYIWGCHGETMSYEIVGSHVTSLVGRGIRKIWIKTNMKFFSCYNVQRKICPYVGEANSPFKRLSLRW